MTTEELLAEILVVLKHMEAMQEWTQNAEVGPMGRVPPTDDELTRESAVEELEPAEISE